MTDYIKDHYNFCWISSASRGGNLMAESLLPDTDAIAAGTLEWT